MTNPFDGGRQLKRVNNQVEIDRDMRIALGDGPQL
jgi:hypothetical protein